MDLLFKKKVNPKVDQISVFSQKIISVATSRIAFAHGIEETSKSFTTIPRNIDDARAPQFEKLSEIYHQISQAHLKLAEDEKRSAEDFRDLVERFVVVERVNASYTNSNEAYQRAYDELIRRKAEQIINNQKPDAVISAAAIEEQIQKAKEVLNERRLELIEKIHTLLDAKKKYNAFKVNRLQHAFHLLANSRAECSRKCAELNNQIIQLGQLAINFPGITELPDHLPDLDLTDESIPQDSPVEQEQDA